jgi:Domain of unknown function (DUF4185)
MKHINIRFAIGSVLFCLSAFSLAQELPYPPSNLVTGLEIDWTTHQRHALGSDNFQLTWADDNHQYGIWGDGDGFAGPNPKYRVSMGVARIEGGYDNYLGYDRYGHKESSEFEANIKGKSWGIICLRGTLYAWIHPDKPGAWGDWEYHNTESRLFVSKNKGASWKAADWAFTQEDDLIGGNILQFGKNNSDALDKYVYHYMAHPDISRDTARKAAELHVPGRIYLLRVPERKIMKRGAYEFFSGFKDGNPTWSENIDDKKPVFFDDNGVGSPIGISFNPGLKKYMLSTEHSKPHSGMLGVFESANPWGPWSTVTYLTNETWFGYDNHEAVPANCFFWCFPVKWISEDGNSATMVFTGGGRGKNNDSFNTVRVKFLKP